MHVQYVCSVYMAKTDAAQNYGGKDYTCLFAEMNWEGHEKQIVVKPSTHIRRIYIANFAIFKIATFWSYHLHLREKIAKFQFHETSRFFGW